MNLLYPSSVGAFRGVSRAWLVSGLLVLLVGSWAWADVSLTTLPRREGTQLTIYNSEDITMVRENRLLTVHKGTNRIQFSWANTLIDPTSIDFRILDNLDKVDLLDTTYPAERNDCLEWNIDSQFDGKIAVEIRYFTSGITWNACYVGIADDKEAKVNLKGYVRVQNNSGELYDNAQVRLVVGNINLVEKIADLANRPAPEVAQKRRESFANALAVAEEADAAFEDESKVRKATGYLRAAVPAVQFDRMSKLKVKKDVIKKGLSEYFLFTIDGREDIKDQEPKQLVAMDIKNVPLDTIYRISDRSNPTQITKIYRLVNEKLKNDDGTEKKLPSMENLGVSPIPDGAVQLYFEYPNQDLAFVGRSSTPYVSIGARLESVVGQDSDITIEKKIMARKVSDVKAKRYKKIINKDRIEEYDLVDYDETVFYEETIVSGKPSLAKIEVERNFGANVILWGSDGKPKDWDENEPGAYVNLSSIAEGDKPGKVERVDNQFVKYYVDLNPGEKRTIRYSVTYKNRFIGPKLNLLSRFEQSKEIPADQSKTGPEPRTPFAIPVANQEQF